jgi:hypothetical protein
LSKSSKPLKSSVLIFSNLLLSPWLIGNSAAFVDSTELTRSQVFGVTGTFTRTMELFESEWIEDSLTLARSLLLDQTQNVVYECSSELRESVHQQQTQTFVPSRKFSGSESPIGRRQKREVHLPKR